MTIKMPMRTSLRELFDRIRHVKYAVISPWRRLPMETYGTPVILTSEFQSISTLWNLTKFSADSQYTAQMSDSQGLVVTVLEKGKNVFPEIFESVILGKRVLHEDCVYVPDSETWPLLRLYWMTFFEQHFADQPEDRKMMIDWLTGKVGASLRPRYRWMNYSRDVVHNPLPSNTHTNQLQRV